MDTLLIMLKNVIIFVLRAVPGYLLVKGKLLTTRDTGVLSKLLTYVGLPAMILSSTMKLSFTGEFTLTMVFTALLGAGLILGGVALTGLVVKDPDAKRRGMLRFCMAFPNNGLIGIPLAQAVFGADSPVMAYLIVLNIINNVLAFTLGAYLVSGDKKDMQLKKALLNPVLLAFFAGIGLNLLKVPAFLPELQTYAGHFGGIVTALSMLVLGIKLAEVPMGRIFTAWRMYYVSLWRLVLLPVLCVGVLFLLQRVPGPDIGADMIVGFFVAFAMPTAGLASAFADQYKGDTENAVICTLGCTVLSVAVMPVLYWLLCLFV